MRAKRFLPLLAAGLVAACESEAPLLSPDDEALQAPASFQASQGMPEFQQKAQHVILTSPKQLGRVATEVEASGGSILFQHETGFIFAQGLSDEAAAELAGVPGVADITADEWFQVGAELTGEPVDVEIASPDDPAAAFFYAGQWNMRAIDAEAAWDAGRLGSPDVTVAILDTGLDYLYPDLLGRVDLARSVSFVPIDDAFAAAFFPGANPIIDLHYHGTHVGATAVSNGFAAAGVTSGATLMGVKVCTFTDFTCSFGAVISGLLYAADNGADVINMSLGGGFPKAGNGRLVGFINQVFRYATRQGATVVVSAGNAASDLDRNGNTFASYCDAPGVVCVSATGPTSSGDRFAGPFFDVDAPAVYTNFGRSAISVAAPGGNTGAPVWAGCSGFSLLLPFCSTGTFIIGISGTSMAAPHVSGLAALLVEDLGRRPGRIKSALQQGADDLGQPGTDKFYGKGRINVGGALGLN